MKVQAVQRTVGISLVKLWDASNQLGLQLQLGLGGLLFTQLAERHSFDCTGNATQVRVILIFAFVLLHGDQPDVHVGPPSCCGNCLCLSLHTESLY